MSEDQSRHIAALEALLFIHGEPLTLSRAAAHLSITEEELSAAAAALGERYKKEDSGLRLLSYDGRLQTITKPEHSGILEKFVKEELSEDLTPATLETISIISYLGPVSRSRIEYLRGVNSVFTLRNLMLRGLIERISDKERTGGVLYQLTPDCLRHLGISSLDELPQYVATREMLEKIERGEEDKDKESEAGPQQPNEVTQ